MTDLTHLIGRLRELADWPHDVAGAQDDFRQAADALQSLTARVGELEGALRPFAVEGRAWKYEFETRGDSRIRIGRNDVNEHFATGISLSDFVRAARANPVEGE